jgi:hypothetical protein
MRIAAAVAV